MAAVGSADGPAAALRVASGDGVSRRAAPRAGRLAAPVGPAVGQRAEGEQRDEHGRAGDARGEPAGLVALGRRRHGHGQAAARRARRAARLGASSAAGACAPMRSSKASTSGTGIGAHGRGDGPDVAARVDGVAGGPSRSASSSCSTGTRMRVRALTCSSVSPAASRALRRRSPTRPLGARSGAARCPGCRPVGRRAGRPGCAQGRPRRRSPVRRARSHLHLCCSGHDRRLAAPVRTATPRLVPATAG